MFGKIHTSETKALWSKANISRKNPMYSKTHKEETIIKMSIVKRGSTIYIFDFRGLLINTFIFAKKAAKYF